MKEGKHEKHHRLDMSTFAWCGLSKNNILRLLDFCANCNCKCQKQNTFRPEQFRMEGAGFENKIKKIFKGSQKSWNFFLKPTINTLAPVIGMAVGAKSKNS